MNCKTEPLVSIVVPTYNDAKNLQFCLQSVINQTFDDWEIIVIDNCSKDNTDEVVSTFSNRNIRVLKICNNGVIASSRNLGIKSSTGRWVAFLDSDDFWYPERLRIAIEAIKKNDMADIFCTNEIVFNVISGKKWELKHGTKDKNVYQSLLMDGNCLSPSATIVRREFLIEKEIFFRENDEFIMSEDYDFWLRLAKNGANFYFINSPQGQYTIHDKNQSNKFELFIKNSMNVVKDHVFNQQDFCNNRELLWKKLRVRYDIPLALFMIKRMKYRDGIKLLVNTLFHSFFDAVKFTCISVIKK